MSRELTLPFVAAIPVGHRIQIVRAQRWESPLFGGAPAWQDVHTPIVIDLDTNVVWTTTTIAVSVVPSPLGFKPNTGYRLASTTEARVTHCIVGTSGGDQAEIRTLLGFDPLPQQGYR